jgi:hypothetical protein
MDSNAQVGMVGLGYAGLPLAVAFGRPITVAEGTNELAKPHEVADLLERILSGAWKAGKIPKRWDGKTAARVVASLKERACQGGT